MVWNFPPKFVHKSHFILEMRHSPIKVACLDFGIKRNILRSSGRKGRLLQGFPCKIYSGKEMEELES
jgi:carbamoylphosphate synthase small subunit